jgi:type I restriction enzyme R subunit
MPGSKKLCRHNQFFRRPGRAALCEDVKAALIWHTQGSGKSLVMVWLAKWIREHVTDPRVLIVTDRTGTGRAD